MINSTKTQLIWVVLAWVFLACVHAQETPVTSVTNSYYTPERTYTPETTLESAGSGSVIVMSGIGPSQTPDAYTWNYTAPASTLQPTGNPALSSSLAKSIDIASTASDLAPDSTNLQIVGRASAAYTVNMVAVALVVVLGSIFIQA